MPFGIRLYLRGDPVAPGGGLPVRAARLLADINEDTPPIPLTGAYTLQQTDNGAIFRSDGSGAIALTVPNTLPEGFNVAIAQWGTGVVTPTAATGTTKRGAGVSTAQYAFTNVYVAKNVDGVSAEFVVLGGT